MSLQNPVNPLETPMDMPEYRTPSSLVHRIEDLLTRQGIGGSVRQESERLVSHALKIKRADLYLSPERICSAGERQVLDTLLKRRLAREPLAYLLESAEFWSLELKIGPGVLIPRSDTECLVETALAVIDSIKAEHEGIDILEFGVGSAAIALALAMERDQLQLVGVDDSAEALYYARQNLNRYQTELRRRANRIHLVQTRFFEGLKPRPTFDILISNPPYIAAADIPHLQAEITGWEPERALNGGIDGMDYHRFLLDEGAKQLKNGGYLIVEHGWDQQARIQALATDDIGFLPHTAHKDMGGNDRVLVFRKTPRTALEEKK